MLETSRLRRAPSRGRGRATVDRILSAADEILATEGAASLGTQRVAEVAGVSIGTVYNWFPDKESIAETLATRYWQDLADLVERFAEASEHARFSDPTSEVVDTLAAGFRSRPGFLALWFGGLRTEPIREATRRNRTVIARSVARVLATQYPGGSAATYETAARMVVLLGDGLLREAFRLDPSGDPAVLGEGRIALRAYITTRLEIPA
jgi:AcrR family transcriptional regulator